MVIRALRANYDSMRQFVSLLSLTLAAACTIPDLSGLLQRVAIVLAYGWVAQVAWRFRTEVGSG